MRHAVRLTVKALLAMAVLLPLARPALAEPTPVAAPEYRQLGLSADQMRRVRELHRATSQRMRALELQLRQQRRSLEEAFKDYHLDEARARQMNARINATQQAILDQHLHLQTELRGILTEEQFGRLRTMMEERRERLRKRRSATPPKG